MNPQKGRYIHDLMNTENDHLKKLHEIVCQAVEQEKLILQNIEKPSSEKLTTGQRIADQVARFGGSWKFIISFAVILIGWIIINMQLPEGKRFDPFPFILLNLVLSCLAAIQAPVIMMSQNRQEEKDRKRNENDYIVNLKAEIEIRTLHQKMDLLLEEQFKKLMEAQADQIRLLQSLIRDEAKLKEANKKTAEEGSKKMPPDAGGTA
ncbi:DUF1003 domain-containing protein [Pseudoflavitalea sp. G-6-1-2]|uniref:DUF1003 domain-containing protein n=1 Tax=Pseudoflavitalea sp. G-6-1-2 TaxID=2728841 RepID=UPI00146AE7C8|nr:DUF1003 domain-containing protein [Pseudoflavitalea sp. G-6-1-2]NML23416.1 DUF1003 domain-containing protein [Pseudoflavitalea sp. G-6-1-2]